MKDLFKKYYIPLGLFLVNFFIKVMYVSHESISHDEPFTMYHAQFDLWYLIDYLKHYNNPPLYEIILHFWIKLFGVSEISVRFLPIIFSSVSVLFIYKIGKDFFNLKIGIISSVLFTFSTMQIWYAHDCRVYTLFLLFTLISFYLFFTFLKNETLSTKHFGILVIVNVLLLYAHYFGFFIWFLEGLIVFLYYLNNKKVLRGFIKIFLLSVLFYVPQIAVLYERFSLSAKNGTWLMPPSGIESIYNMIWSFANAPVVSVLSIVLLVVGLIKFLFFTKRKIENQFVKYVVIWFLFPFFFMFFISYKIPMFLDRYLIFVTPAFYLLLAISIVFLFPKKIVFNSVAVLLIGAFILSSSFNPSKKRLVKDTVDFIKMKKDSNSIVLVCSPEFMTNFVYYYNQNYFKEIDQKSEYGKIENLMKSENVYFINRLDSNIYDKVKQFKKIIYLDAGADFSSPNNQIKSDLLSKYKLTEEKFYDEIFNIYIF